MNDLEDRLRDAYRGATGTVRPETIRELRVTGARSRRAVRGRSRWTGILIPLGAAAAVAGLVLGALAIVPKPDGRAALAPATGSHRAQSPAAPMPRFAVIPEGSVLTVISTATGRVIARLPALAGQAFEMAAAAADDRTFLVTADLNPQTSCETFLYEVRLSDTGQPSGLAPFVMLPGQPSGLYRHVTAGLAGVLPTAVGLSPDGSTAALSTVRCAGETPGHIGSTQVIGGIYLVSTASHRVTRQWSYTLADDYTHTLSLSADGSKLAFTMSLGRSDVARLLPTSAPSGPVDSASRIVLRPPPARFSSSIESAQLSPDGNTIYACTTAASGYPGFTMYLASWSVSTGRLTRQFRTWTSGGALSCALTMDPGGRYVLVSLGDTPDGKLNGRPAAGKPVKFKPVTTRLIAVDVASGAFTTLPATMDGPAVEGDVTW